MAVGISSGERFSVVYSAFQRRKRGFTFPSCELGTLSIISRCSFSYTSGSCNSKLIMSYQRFAKSSRLSGLIASRLFCQTSSISHSVFFSTWALSASPVLRRGFFCRLVEVSETPLAVRLRAIRLVPKTSLNSRWVGTVFTSHVLTLFEIICPHPPPDNYLRFPPTRGRMTPGHF